MINKKISFLRVENGKLGITSFGPYVFLFHICIISLLPNFLNILN